MSDPDCQCSLWTTKPDFLASQGLPRGYCGHCEVCGQAGHVRHFPGPSASTGVWCDRHYRRTAWLHPMGWYGRRLFGGALLGLIVAFVLWRA